MLDEFYLMKLCVTPAFTHTTLFQEIEADKKNADKFSSSVIMEDVKPYVMKVPRTRPEKSDRPREMSDQPIPPRPADVMPGRQRLSEVGRVVHLKIMG